MTDIAAVVDSTNGAVDTRQDNADDFKKAIKARDEAKARARELEKQNEELAKFKQQTEAERMSESEKLNARIAELEAKAGKADIYESAVLETLAAKIEAVPEERRGLIPDQLSPADQLKYIAKNEAYLIGKPVASSVSLVGGTPPGKPAPSPTGTLNEAEKRVVKGLKISEADYLANKGRSSSAFIYADKDKR